MTKSFLFKKNWSNLNVLSAVLTSAIDFTTPVALCSENPCQNRLCTYWGLYAKVSWETFRACFLQSHYREVPQWEIFMEQELRFGLDLGRFALLKKNIWADYEQILRTVISSFRGQTFLFLIFYRLRKIFNCFLLTLLD